MLYRYFFVVLLVLSNIVSAQEGNNPDPEVIEFSNYMSDVSYLNGMFDGVLEYCKPYISKSLAQRAASKWDNMNGVYIDAIDDALHILVKEKVTEERKDFVTDSLKKNISGWYKDSYEKNEVLAKVKQSETKRFACAKNLGVMNSDSFNIKK